MLKLNKCENYVTKNKSVFLNNFPVQLTKQFFELRFLLHFSIFIKIYIRQVRKVNTLRCFALSYRFSHKIDLKTKEFRLFDFHDHENLSLYNLVICLEITGYTDISLTNETERYYSHIFYMLIIKGIGSFTQNFVFTWKFRDF